MNKQFAILDTESKIYFKYYENSIQLIPTLATDIIYDEVGTEKRSSQASTILGDGTIEITLADTLLTAIAKNWKAEITFTVNSVEKKAVIIFDIVRYESILPVTDQDILNNAPFVKDMNYRKLFTASSGTLDTILNPNELQEIDDYWTAGNVEILGGANEGEKRKVKSFVNRVITVDNPFSNVIDNTSEVLLIRSFNQEIINAYNQIIRDLRRRNIMIYQILDYTQLFDYVLNYALYLICNNYMTDPLDVWSKRAMDYKETYDELFNSLNLDYDYNNDGNVESNEINKSFGEIEGVR